MLHVTYWYLYTSKKPRPTDLEKADQDVENAELENIVLQSCTAVRVEK